jgi:hypothetical protein
VSHQYRPDGTRINHCTLCADTGFLRGADGTGGLDCPGDGRCSVGGCGREGRTTYAHTYTRPCFCRGTNPHLVEAREHANAHAQTLTSHKPDRHSIRGE